MACKLMRNNDAPNGVAVNEYYCDIEADIELLPRFNIKGKFEDPYDSFANTPCSIGSTALVCSTSDVWILSPNNQWVKL